VFAISVQTTTMTLSVEFIHWWRLEHRRPITAYLAGGGDIS